MTVMVKKLMGLGIAPTTLSRMEAVYGVYGNRADPYQSVRRLLPPRSESIGFAGTTGESQYSFWLPLGTKRVTDYTPQPDGTPPDPTGFDAIVASDWGTKDRFGISPQELADRLGWEIVGKTAVKALVSAEGGQWSVLVPKNSNKGGR